MKTQTRNLLLGGAVVLGGVLSAWYFYNKSQPVEESTPISKEIVIQIIKEQEREFYQVFKCVNSIYRDIVKNIQETKGDLDIPSEKLKAAVFMQCRLSCEL